MSRRDFLKHLGFHQTKSPLVMSNEVTIIQINRAICEFTGWEFKPDGEDWFKAYYEGKLMWAASGKELNKILLEGFKFHEDWNKLMPVVEKIENNHAHVRVQAGICAITHRFMSMKLIAKEKGIPMDEVMPIAEYNDKGFIGNVYHAIYDFIIWYNENQQK